MVNKLEISNEKEEFDQLPLGIIAQIIASCQLFSGFIFLQRRSVGGDSNSLLEQPRQAAIVLSHMQCRLFWYGPQRPITPV